MLGKHQLVIENRPSSVVGQAFVARAKPDGYTVLAMTSSVVTNPKIKDTPFKLSDFKPVGSYMLTPELICVSTKSSIKTIDDFVKVAREKPVSMAMSEVGTSHHMAGLALESYGGIKIKFVNIKAFGEQLQQVMGGHVDGALWPTGEAAPQIEAKVVRPLAVSSRGRFPQFPDLPTWSEAGLNVKEFATVRGWGVPKDTPDAIVDYLDKLLAKITSNPETAKLIGSAEPVIYQDRKGFSETLDTYDELTTKIMKSAGLGKK